MAQQTAPVYRISFLQQGRVYELYARSVSQGGLLGFIEVEELLFGERSQVVVDPSEERLKTEFDGVERFYLPIHSVLRIDQVARQGAARIVDSKESPGKVAPFPMPIYPPGEPRKE
ncbi:MAG: DUF1820 family protein [Thermoanaerobaculia bacterium]|nr:DUF1820 family protein [Thermoanaerobaculia bacterium]